MVEVIQVLEFNPHYVFLLMKIFIKISSHLFESCTKDAIAAFSWVASGFVLAPPVPSPFQIASEVVLLVMVVSTNLYTLLREVLPLSCCVGHKM